MKESCGSGVCKYCFKYSICLRETLENPFAFFRNAERKNEKIFGELI